MCVLRNRPWNDLRVPVQVRRNASQALAEWPLRLYRRKRLERQVRFYGVTVPPWNDAKARLAALTSPDGNAGLGDAQADVLRRCAWAWSGLATWPVIVGGLVGIVWRIAGPALVLVSISTLAISEMLLLNRNRRRATNSPYGVPATQLYPPLSVLAVRTVALWAFVYLLAWFPHVGTRHLPYW